jgi:murein DD-endopeptidase MepM/ murein hydrolase activator NlpD
VTVTIDSANEVIEASELDNTLSFTWTVPNSTDLPSKFVWPVAGHHNVDWAVSNYLDTNFTNGVFRDFRGGLYAYDGHDSIDVSIPDFGSMDRGVAVLAAASGTVVGVRDGEFDRTLVGRDPVNAANYVEIDHGNGWGTSYSHLASQTLTVKPGDRVSAGQQIGLVGSSGNSFAPHLHFTVMRYHQNGGQINGLPVETMFAPQLYYVVPPVYQPGVETEILASGVTNINIDQDYLWQERPSDKRIFSVNRADSPRVWFTRYGVQIGDVTHIRWLRPDGSLAELDTLTSAVDTYGIEYRTFPLDATNWRQFPGTWTAVIEVNGRELRREQLQLLASTTTPEIRISLNQRQIPDGRTSPISFGTLVEGSTAPTQQFLIENHGDGPLTLSGLFLPNGFALASAFPSSIPAGGSATFTISMPTGTAGRFFGDLRFATNDSDEETFNFVIAGEVTPAASSQQPAIVPSGRAAIFQNGATVLIDPSLEVTGIGPGSLNGTRLQVWVATGGQSGDQLSIIHQGNALGQIGVSGSTLRFEGVVIGSISTLNQGQFLDVTLNSSATAAAVQAMYRRVGFLPTANPFVNERRTLGMQAIWNNGSKSLLKTVSVIGATPQTIASPVLLNPPAVSASNRPPIEWAPVTGALGYDVWISRRTSPSVPVLRQKTMLTKLIPSAPLPIGDLQVWVRTMYPSGQFSAWSAARSFKITSPVTLIPPAARQTTFRPRLEWNGLAGASRYDLWVNNVSTGQNEIIRQSTLTGTSFIPASDLSLGTYRFWVRGIDVDGVAATWSQAADFTIVAPAQIQSPVSVMTLNPRPVFQWSVVPGAASYDLFIRNLDTGASITPRGISATSWTSSSDMQAANYRWWVQAVSSQGIRSDWSAQAEFNTGGRTVMLLPNGQVTNGLPTFTWRAVIGASQYELWVNRDGGPARIINELVTTTSFQPNQSLPKGTYRAWVRAFSGSVAGPWTGTAVTFEIV